MKCKVLEYFTDLQDNNYAYREGDVYPREGYTPTKERIEELASDKNIRNRPIIKEITAEKEEASEIEVEESIEEKPKKRKHNKDDE